MMGRWQRIEKFETGVALIAGALLGGVGCGGSQGSPEGAIGAGMCSAPTQVADPCSAFATGTITACGQDSDGQPSQTGYFGISMPDGSRSYVCATSWGPKTGYWFDHPDQLMSDPQSCCGGAPTPVAAPTAPKPAIGYLGAPHAPHDIKPWETAQPGAGLLKHAPFGIVVTDPGGATAFQAAVPDWNAWVGDGIAHPAPDGSGSYYFTETLVNYTILATSDGQPIIVAGPEVSPTSDGKSPLGHPTMGACPMGGGAPMVLMAGEIDGTMIDNHTGRFGWDASVTQEALDNAAKLFNCVGIPVSSTIYYPAKP